MYELKFECIKRNNNKKKNRYKIYFIVNYNYKAVKHRTFTYIDVYNIIEVITKLYCAVQPHFRVDSFEQLVSDKFLNDSAIYLFTFFKFTCHPGIPF